MWGKLFFCLFCVAAVTAMPNGYLELEQFDIGQNQDFVPELEVEPQIFHRVRRQSQNDKPFQLQGGGGGNRKDGFNVNLDSKFKVWESPNKRHEIHGTAGYSQHLGGQYGSSKPDYRGGAGYTFRF